VVVVEARIDFKGGSIRVVKHVAGVVSRLIKVRIRENREWTLGRRECAVRFEVGRIVAVLVRPAEGVHVRLVDVEEVLPVLDEGENDSLLLQSRVADEGIVDGDAAELEVVIVIGRDEGVGDVGDVKAGVGLARDVSRGAFEVEGGDEVAPKASELLGELDFIGDVGGALAEADADGLLDPDDVCTGLSVGEYVCRVVILTDSSSCTSLAWERGCPAATGRGRSQ
jgi:hypothetical protein